MIQRRLPKNVPCNRSDVIAIEVPSQVPTPLRMRVAVLITVLLPFAGLIAGIALTWPFGFWWLHLGLLLGMYTLTVLGVTVGYHRFFTHRSFATNRVVMSIMGILGSMAVEGPLLIWVATHRCHHQHSDAEADPHSPHTHGGGLLNMIRGLWHAHIGWMLSSRHQDLSRYVQDLARDRLVRTISRLFPLWVLLGMVLPAALGGLLTWSWLGVLLGFVWGGLVRVFLVHHVTWSVNSVCHIWGRQPFNCRDESRNNAICAILAFGEGWHNNHHAFPTSARHGLRWWELDCSYLVIRALVLVGLARDVRVPAIERIVSKRLNS